MKLLIIILAYVGLGHGQLSSILPKCRRNDPKLEECLLRVFEAFRPQLKDPIIPGVPTLDPLTIDAYSVNYSLPGLAMTAIVQDIVIKGLSNIKFPHLKINAKTKKANLTVVIPRLVVTYGYHFECHHNDVFDVLNAGRFTGTFFDINSNSDTRGKINNDILTLTYINLDVSFGKRTTYHFTTTKGTEPGKLATLVLNKTPKSLALYFLKKFIDNFTGRMLTRAVNSFLEKLPLRHILEPPNFSSGKRKT